MARLRASGRRVVFVTNNSGARLADQEAALAAIGIPADGDVMTSAHRRRRARSSAASGCLTCGGPGVAEAVAAVGAIPVAGDDPGGEHVDVVVVGFHREFDYERMRIAATAVRNGARLIGDQRRRDVPDAGRTDPRRWGDPRRRADGRRCDRRTIAGKPYRRWRRRSSTMLGGVPAAAAGDGRRPAEH